MHQFIQCEIAKCLDTLAETDPRSEEYSRVLGGLHNVYTLKELLEECIDIMDNPEDGEKNTPKIVDFPIQDSPFPEEITQESVKNLAPTQEEIEEIASLNPTDAQSNTESREITFDELRSALVEARMTKGLNAAELIRKYGVTNLTALPKDKYAAVLAEVESL